MAVPWFFTERDTEIFLPAFPVAGPVIEETIKSGLPGTTAVPLTERVEGLPWLLPLCSIDKVPENVPAWAGESRTTTDFDWPRERLKGPLPLATEKGA